MDWRVIEAAGKYAGLSGIALIVLGFMILQMFKLPIFDNLGKDGTVLTINNVINKLFWVTILALLSWLAVALFGKSGQQNPAKPASNFDPKPAVSPPPVPPVACDEGAATKKCREEYIAGRLPEARGACMHAIECAPREADNYLRVAKIDYKEGKDFDHGLEYVNDAIERDPANCDSYYMKSKILIHLGKYDEALKAADVAIKICPSLTSAHYERGKIYARKAESMSDSDALQFDLWDKAIDDLITSGEEGKDDLVHICEEHSDRLRSSHRTKDVAAAKACPAKN